MRRTALPFLLLVLILAGPASGRDRTVLLMTSPRAGEIKNIVELVERGWLKAKNLRLIGVRHAAEQTDYSKAHAYLHSHDTGRIELQSLDCDLDKEKVFTENGCSAKFERLFSESDGIVFTGGPDMPPALYGQPTLLTTVIVDPPRHRFEISFLVHLLVGDPKTGRKPLLDKRPDYLVLGLCLGMQTMNVATGGTLYQDIPSQVYGKKTLEQYARLNPAKRHRSAEAQLHPSDKVGWGHFHPVRFRPHPLTEKLLPDKKPVQVISVHHQAIRRAGHGLKILATSTDGKVIEAMVHERYPAVLGVGFHPEKRILYNPDLVYRKNENAEKKNFAAATLAADERSLAFHERFWYLVSKLLAKSASARPAK